MPTSVVLLDWFQGCKMVVQWFELLLYTKTKTKRVPGLIPQLGRNLPGWRLHVLSG